MVVKANIQPDTFHYWIYSRKQNRNTLKQDGAMPYSLEKGETSRVKEVSGSVMKEISGTEINLAEKRMVDLLKSRDAEVRAHEQAHMSAAGGVATSGPQYIYIRGPDGRLYAVGGEVSIDSSPVPGNPEQTIKKAQKIRRAAFAPANPSSQDMRVAAAATRMEQQARIELRREKAEEKAGEPGRINNPANNEAGKDLLTGIIGRNTQEEGLHTITERLYTPEDNIRSMAERLYTREDGLHTRTNILSPRIEDIYSDKAAGISEESNQFVDLLV